MCQQKITTVMLEQTLAMFDPQRDRDLTYRFGQDMGVSAMVFMALALWPLGETDELGPLAAWRG
jgi:hypothetical protein